MSETTEAQENLPPATPLEKAIQKAQKELTSYQQDMLSAGISEDQIKAISANAEQRIRQEHEEREKQDPLELLEDVLEKTAQTDDEKYLAEGFVRSIDWNRKNIQEFAGKAPFTQFSDRPRLSMQTEWKGDDGYLPKLHILGSATRKNEQGENIDVKLPIEYEERFLREMGVMEPDQSMNDFMVAAQNLPKVSRYPNSGTGPILLEGIKSEYTVDRISRIPTNIPGIDVEIPLWPNHHGIFITMSVEAAKKVQVK